MADSASPSNSATRVCPTCKEVIGQRDKFCPMCGANLARTSNWVAPVTSTENDSSASTSPAEEIVPLTGLEAGQADSRHRRKSKKRSWYKRPLYIIPLVLLLVLGGIVSVLAWQTRSALDEVNSVSTPPPEVSASSLGGNEDVAIDTGPAQAALAEREERDELPITATETPASETETPSAGVGSTETGQSSQSSTPGASLAPVTVLAGASPAVGGSTPLPAEVVDDPPATTTPSDSPVVASEGLTILVMGVDSREGEAIDIGVRPDSLAVLHINRESGSCRMLAVPRDSRAELPGYGYSKINHALAVAGIPYEMLVVEEYLGLQLEHYALIDFAGLETLVDSLGGITVENPAEFVMGGQTFAAGTLHLNGEQALLYSRFRGDDQGDFGRISRQQQVLRAMLNETTDVNVVTTLPTMFTTLSDHVRTDFGAGDLVDIANDYRNVCTADSIETQTIAGTSSMAYDELMQQELSFVLSDPAVVQQNVAWLLGETDDQPIDDLPSTPVAALPGPAASMNERLLRFRSA